MSEPLRKIKSTDNYVNSNTSIKFYRIAFKVTTAAYDFRKYDQINLESEHISLFDDNFLRGSTFYDLCHQNGRYQAFNHDFAQTYFLKLFHNSPFPCNIFVFVEEVSMQKGIFVEEPHNLTISSTTNARSMGSRAKAKANKAKAKSKTSGGGSGDSELTFPDYELFYIESPTLSVEAGSVNDLFLSLCSRYIRGSSVQCGVGFIRHHAFACCSDCVGMEFMRYIGFRGLVPTMATANTMVPLILLIGQALGYKHSLQRINKLVGRILGDKMQNSARLRRRYRRNLKDLTFLYHSVELFLTKEYLVSSIDPKNRLALDMSQELANRLDLNGDYQRLKEQMTPLSHILSQLSTLEIIKAQGTIRFAVVFMGFIIVIAVVIVCVILGVEPVMRLLNQLGLLPPNLLR